MLHNSMFRRDMLREMNRHPLVVWRREGHRNVGVRADAKPQAAQVAMTGAWAVRTARDVAAERAVAKDAEDFLKRLGVTIDPAATKQLLLEIGSCDVGFRCLAVEDRIEVHAADASALWAGWVHFENEMRSVGGAIVTRGEIHHLPAWDVQIAPPTWGANYSVPDLSPEFVGDETFAELAHHGANGMFVYGDFVLYAQGTRFKELEHPDAAKHLKMLREASERAAAYGVKLYFVAVSPKLPADHALFKRLPAVRGAKLAFAPSTGVELHCLCASSEEALGFHADVMGRLFKEAPELGGLILIIGGESYYHCFMRSADSAIGETNCPQCKGKVAEDVIGNFLKVTADAVRSATPQAAVMAWPYSAQAFWSREANQLRLIDRLPEGVALLSEIDKDQIEPRAGYSKNNWDYTVDFDGHSDRIVAQAIRCAQRDRELFIKTETSHGIELLHLPYVPAIGRSARQWESVRAVRPKGVLQRWGFIGMYDSVAERIGYLARWDPDFTPERATMQVARQMFGDAANPIVSAWKRFDESVHHIPILTTGGYYCGPAFLGPAHPLATWDGPTPDDFRGNLYYLAEAEATLSSARNSARDDLTISTTAQLGGAPIEIIEAEFTRARDEAEAGHKLLAEIDASKFPPHIREEVIEQQAIGEYLYRTYRATVNTIKFMRAKERKDAKEVLQGIARDELGNTKSARKVYEIAPWLNHNLRLDVGVNDSVKMIDAKIRLLESFLAG